MILGYARVSTQGQATPEKTSLEDQENKIRAYATSVGADRFGIQVYVDAGVSGAVPLDRRDAGRRLLADVRPGDVIVAAKLDRLFRSAVDALTTAERWQEEGIKLVLYDISTEPVYDSPVAKMFFNILAAVANFERERIGERIEAGRRGKAEKGGHLGGLAPFGYRIEGARASSRLVPNSEEQAVLKLMRKRIEQMGDTPTDVANFLNEERIATRSGKPWQCVQVQRALRAFQ